MMRNIVRFLTAFPKIISARIGLREHRPCIGIAVSDAWPDRFQFRRLPYDLAIARARGNVCTFTPQDLPELDSKFACIDGLLLAGGEDVHPEHYGGDEDAVGKVNIERDELEMILLEEAARRRLPVLCVCRGAQLLAVWAGGRLESMDENTKMMKIHVSTLRRFARHRLCVKPGTRIFNILGDKPLKVNSFHHQTIIDPGKLHISAFTTRGSIEGVELEGDRFVVGVQWHPEFQAIFNLRHQALFSALVAAARDFRKEQRKD